MRRFIALSAALFLGLSTAASAGVVTRLTPSLGSNASPVPALSLSMSAPVSASFMPALTGAISAPSLSAPSPALLPAPLVVTAVAPAVAAAVPALAAAPLPAPASHYDGRGPPSARDSGYSAFVAKSVAETVRSWAVPVEDIFSKHDALLVGENHGSLTSVDILTREMPRLAAAGVTAIGIEGLKRNHQVAVDEFVAGRRGDLSDEALSFSPKRRASFRALLDAARDHGVRVVALGLPLDGWAKAAAELAAAKTGRPAEEFPKDVDSQFSKAGDGYEPGFNEAVAEVFLTRRNQAMASFLKEALKTGGKAVALVGQAHVDGLDMVPGRLMNAPGDWGTLARELGSLALRAYSLTMTGGVFTDPHASQVDRSARPASYRAAAAAAPAGARAYRELGPGRALWHAGGTIEPSYAH
ncbi:MAG: ChaN family lipoprotein [Elusimicrobiota bacterium]|nr:ChaN family lipoprotein [Elusimicrobiota bacterium]